MTNGRWRVPTESFDVPWSRRHVVGHLSSRHLQILIAHERVS
jgi:hypothetical protein